MSAVMGVLIISFAIWGIADMFKGSGQTTVATIGKTEITTEQFRQTFTEKLQQISRQVGRPITPDQARAFGLDRQVLQQAVAEAALDEDARIKGLGASDAEVMRQIVEDPNFKGVTGAFDPQRFQQLIRSLGFTEARYINEQRKVTLRRQIAGTVTAGIEPSNTMIEALSRFQNEQRTIEYVTLGAEQAGTIETPAPDVLATYFDANKNAFRAPEYRKIAFVVMTPEELAKWSVVSDEDAKKVFEQDRERITTPEQREISQIMFPTVEDAKAARDKLSATVSFDDLAKERGLTAGDIDLGLVAKAGIIDTSIADAAFTLATGAISEPIKGTFGYALIKVGKIEKGTTPTYESVAVQLKGQLAVERARAAVADMHNKMEDERGGGSSVLEAAKKLGLKAVSIEAVDRSGRAPDGTPVADLPSGVDLVSTAFTSDVGVDNDALQLNGGYVWFDVLGVTPSRERPLDEVKDQVEARWRNEEIATRLRAKATEMVAKLGTAGKFADVSGGLKVETSEPFKRDATIPGLPPAITTEAFRTAKNAAAQAAGATSAVVFRVTDITAPPVDMASEATTKLKDTLRRNLTDEQVSEYVGKLEAEIGTKINPAALAQATGATSTN